MHAQRCTAQGTRKARYMSTYRSRQPFLYRCTCQDRYQHWNRSIADLWQPTLENRSLSWPFVKFSFLSECCGPYQIPGFHETALLRRIAAHRRPSRFDSVTKMRRCVGAKSPSASRCRKPNMSSQFFHWYQALFHPDMMTRITRTKCFGFGLGSRDLSCRTVLVCGSGMGMFGLAAVGYGCCMSVT